ncbi:MAG: VWA domain-containing protein [Rhodospirillales bacterium]|nr:VWA domain-containing protein [Rhodospirillales bacterium]MDE0380006.1 VWA domain-containing protein [Rhodospirillales bacterium]
MATGFFHRLARQGTGTAARCGERPGAWRFLRDVRGGATSILATMVTVMTVAAVALIVDHNWLVDQRDTIKNASDAAALAATIEMTRPGVHSKSDSELIAHLKRVAKTYATLNLSHLTGERLQKAKDSLDVEVTPDRDSNTVEVKVTADLGGTLFSRHLPIMGNYEGPEDGIVAVAKVEGTSNPIEVVLAIDISGSMDWKLDSNPPKADRSDSRMAIVKRAASALVDILEPNAENRVAVGLVPWQAQVRLDEDTREDWEDDKWAEYPETRHYDSPYSCKPVGSCSVEVDEIEDYEKSQTLPQGEVWLGCLDEHRVDEHDNADMPEQTPAALMSLPSESAFAQGVYVSAHAHAYKCLQLPLPTDFVYQQCYEATSLPKWRLVWGGKDAQRFCSDDPATILPLTTDATNVKDAIDNLKPVGHATNSALGVLWGQRLLTHSWKGVWGDSVHPVDPTSEESTGARKAIVLLTDGEDNVCGYADRSCTHTDVAIARETACTIAKNAGIEVFVIAAMHPDQVNEALGTSLKACSSQTDNPEGEYVFLNNSDDADLEAAFADIANQLKVFRRVY